ncbi:MAG TPA: TonB-dependent receptor, partial [Saprospiraceae bacterium]|nr:TonB-dependent receptor [Saprospiraceae bacterium]
MKQIFAFVFFCLLSFFAQAQTTITGTIQDQSNNPLGFANVYIENSFAGTTANADGTFSLETELTGPQVIIADFLGFEQSKTEINIQGTTLQISIVLKEKFNELKAVTVTAGSFEANDKKKAAVLKPLDVVTTAGAMGDIGNALQTFPGTTTVGESGRLFVRGGSSEETQTYIDGMHVPIAYTSGSPNIAVRGRFNPFLFKGTVFNTGGYSAEYGQALSSVLLLQTQGFDSKERIDISLMSIGAGLSGTKVWDRTAVTATLDYTNLSPYFKLAKQRFKVNEAWHSISGALSLRQKTGKSGMLKLYATNSVAQNGLEVFDFYATDNKQDYYTKNDNSFVNLSWMTPLSKRWVLRAGSSYSLDNNDITYGQADLSNEFNELHTKANLTYLYSPKVSVKFGGEYFALKSKRPSYRQRLEINNSAAFAEANIFLSNNFVVKLGLRGEYDDYLQAFQLAPRFSSALKTGKKSQISFAYGQFYQNPQESFLALNSHLKFRKADHYILNYQIEKNKRLLRTEVYYKKYDRLIRYTNPMDSHSYTQDGDGYASGLDVFFRDAKTIKNSKFWLSYSYLLSERLY